MEKEKPPKKNSKPTYRKENVYSMRRKYKSKSKDKSMPLTNLKVKALTLAKIKNSYRKSEDLTTKLKKDTTVHVSEIIK